MSLCPDELRSPVGRYAAVLVAAAHHHAREREGVLVGGVVGQPGAGEEVVARAVVLRAVRLVLVGVEVLLVALRSAVVGPVAVAYVEVALPPAYVEVHVAAGVGAALGAAAGLHGAVVSGGAVFLQHYVYYAGAALGTVLGRGVVDHLYPVDALGGQLLQYLGAVVAGQSAGLAVYPHLDAGVAAQRYVAVGVDFHRRYVLEHVAGHSSGVAYVLGHVERLAVHFQAHGRALGRHGDFLQRLAVLRQVDGLEVGVAVLGLEGEVLVKLGVPYVRQPYGVAAVGQARDVEQAFLVGYGPLDEFLRGLVVHGDVHERHRPARARIDHLSSYAALRVAEGCAQYQ